MCFLGSYCNSRVGSIVPGSMSCSFDRGCCSTGIGCSTAHCTDFGTGYSTDCNCMDFDTGCSTAHCTGSGTGSGTGCSTVRCTRSGTDYSIALDTGSDTDCIARCIAVHSSGDCKHTAHAHSDSLCHSENCTRLERYSC